MCLPADVPRMRRNAKVGRVGTKFMNFAPFRRISGSGIVEYQVSIAPPFEPCISLVYCICDALVCILSCCLASACLDAFECLLECCQFGTGNDWIFDTCMFRLIFKLAGMRCWRPTRHFQVLCLELAGMFVARAYLAIFAQDWILVLASTKIRVPGAMHDPCMI